MPKCPLKQLKCSFFRTHQASKIFSETCGQEKFALLADDDYVRARAISADVESSLLLGLPHFLTANRIHITDRPWATPIWPVDRQHCRILMESRAREIPRPSKTSTLSPSPDHKTQVRKVPFADHSIGRNRDDPARPAESIDWADDGPRVRYSTRAP